MCHTKLTPSPGAPRWMREGVGQRIWRVNACTYLSAFDLNYQTFSGISTLNAKDATQDKKKNVNVGKKPKMKMSNEKQARKQRPERERERESESAKSWQLINECCPTLALSLLATLCFPLLPHSLLNCTCCTAITSKGNC